MLRKSYILVIALLLPGSLFAQLSVEQGARFKGNFGLQVDLTGSFPMELTDGTIDNEPNYTGRFYMRTTDLDLDEGESLVLLRGNDASDESQFELSINKTGGVVLLNVAARLDDGTLTSLGTGDQTPITNGWHALGVKFVAGDGTGLVNLFLDGTQMTGLEDLDNDTATMDNIQIGAMSPTGTPSGSYQLDDYDSRRLTPIGLTCLTNEEILGLNPLWNDPFDVRRIIEYIPFRCEE